MQNDRLSGLIDLYLDLVTIQRMRDRLESVADGDDQDEPLQAHVYQPTRPQLAQQPQQQPQQPQTNGQLPPAPPHRKQRRAALPQPPQGYQDPNGGGQQ